MIKLLCLSARSRLSPFVPCKQNVYPSLGSGLLDCNLNNPTGYRPLFMCMALLSDGAVCCHAARPVPKIALDGRRWRC